MNISDSFVETLYSLHSKPMTDELEHEARLCLLDELACIFAGVTLQNDRINAYLDSFTGDEAVVIGMNRRASLQNAALVNGILGHTCDFDDGHRFSTVHLGSTVIPALLAVAEKERLDMKDILRGTVIGYEAAVRLGRCVQPAHRARGFHSSGTVGTVGAAMALASALNFTKEQFKAALSSAVTSAAGVLEMMEDVSSLKPYNVGRAAHDGITAAYIARSGFCGPYDPLGGRFGFLKTAGDSVDEKVLTLEFDSGYNITGSYHKPYAACRHVHASVYAALQAARQCDASWDDIEKIDVGMYAQGIKGHDHTEIPSPVAGKMSAPFCIALALKTGTAGVSSFGEEQIHDRGILELTKKVTVTENPEFTSLVPAKRAAEVTVVTTDGRTGCFRADYAPGEPELPLSVDDLAEKFRSNSGLSAERNEEIISLVLNYSGPASGLISALC